jgi:hypothetical protein
MRYAIGETDFECWGRLWKSCPGDLEVDGEEWVTFLGSIEEHFRSNYKIVVYPHAIDIPPICQLANNCGCHSYLSRSELRHLSFDSLALTILPSPDGEKTGGGRCP